MTAAEALAAEIRRHVFPSVALGHVAYRSWYHTSSPLADLPEALAADLLAAGYGLVRDGTGEHFIDANERMGTEIVTLRARVAELEAERAQLRGVADPGEGPPFTLDPETKQKLQDDLRAIAENQRRAWREGSQIWLG